MIILGLVLLLLIGGLVADAVVENGQHTNVTLFHQNLNMHSWGIFVAGMVAGAIACIGLWMLKGGLARDSRRRREHRQLLRENQAATAERDRAREREAAAEAKWAGSGAVASGRRNDRSPESVTTGAARRREAETADGGQTVEMNKPAAGDTSAGSGRAEADSSADAGTKPGVFARLRR